MFFVGCGYNSRAGCHGARTVADKLYTSQDCVGQVSTLDPAPLEKSDILRILH